MPSMFAANTGGLLGLCLGFSGLSLIELIYFYTLRAWCRTRRRRSVWSIVGMKLHRMWHKGHISNDRYLNGATRDHTRRESRQISFHERRSSSQAGSSKRFRHEDAYHQHQEASDGLSTTASRDNRYDNDNPFIVVPQESKPSWGKFAGFGSQFSHAETEPAAVQ
jgi:hypothetical protein